MNVAATTSVSFSPSRTRIASVVDKEMARIQCYVLLGLSDIVALAAAFFSANLLYMGDPLMQHGLVMFTVIAPIYLGIAALHHAYNGQTLERVWQGMWRSLRALIFAAACVMFIAYFLKAGGEFSRAVFAIGFAGSIVLLPLSRYILSRPILALLGGSPYSTVVIRDDVPFEPREFDVVLTCEQLQFDPDTRDPGLYHDLAEVVANADRVIVACPQARYAQWASVLKGMAVNGEIVTDEHDHLGIIGVSSHGVRRTMVVAAGPLNLRDRILKRLLDIAFSAAGLVLLSPLLLVVAVAIKLESPGPVLFIQNRIGRDNRIFRMYKFRSMRTELCDENGSALTTRFDKRVTRVGEFIRRTSIDELPQLFNVLKGDMSVVGPRPHPLSAKAADLLYWDVDPRYRHRHSMKPGLTGLAQVRGFRGNTERIEDLTNRLQADLEYAANWSLWHDIRIILQTIAVLKHQNAF